MVHKLAPIHQGQGKTEEANHSWLVGSSFKSKKLKRFALGKKKKKKNEETSTPTNRSQSFCRGRKWSLVMCTTQMVSTKHYSLKAALLRHLLVWGWDGVGGGTGETHIPRTGEG